MSARIEIDAAWRAANPLSPPSGEISKNDRGRVLAIGGARSVPGAILLTGEAALRVGAGKVRMATIRDAALAVGIAFPEAAVVALDEDADGEIGGDPQSALSASLKTSDAVVAGPGMGGKQAAARLVRALAADPDGERMLVLDAAAVACAGPLCDLLGGYGGRLVLTPHLGEMAALAGCDIDRVAADPDGIATRIAAQFAAVVVLKGAQTVIAAPDGTLLHYAGGGVGLGTGGSGDVLAGAVAGLLSRGVDPLAAAGWGVWLHGEAGRALAVRHGTVGFLARELLPELPRLLPR
ncbi:MAG TPA: NAD(P)H-hydrate dehydratase [Sphingomonas sp.]|uniref:NAD(P)H-hydrate dehydratase n=1 Tax=Sphingomonas sp. TaxID=28214 RepID=UPI002EDAEF64